MLRKEGIAVFLQKVARFKGLSDGAKVTLLEFLYHFWTLDKQIPTYSEFCEIRSMARSTVQAHIEELESAGLLCSARLPDNRKRYSLNINALDGVKTDFKQKGRQPRHNLHKHIAKFTTAEICQYISFHLSEALGRKYSNTSQDYALIRDLHKRYKASELVEAVDYFVRVYHRRKWPFTFKAFYDAAAGLIDVLKQEKGNVSI